MQGPIKEKDNCPDKRKSLCVKNDDEFIGDIKSLSSPIPELVFSEDNPLKIDKLRNFISRKMIPALRFINTLKNNEVKYFRPRHAKMLNDVSVNFSVLQEMETHKESKNNNTKEKGLHNKRANSIQRTLSELQDSFIHNIRGKSIGQNSDLKKELDITNRQIQNKQKQTEKASAKIEKDLILADFKSFGIFDPDSWVFMIWDCIIVTFIYLQIFGVSYITSYHDVRDYPTEYAQVPFVCDMLLQFNTGTYIRGRKCQRRINCIMVYLKKSFWIDLIAQIPIIYKIASVILVYKYDYKVYSGIFFQ